METIERLIQNASIYEQQGYIQKAVELYTKALAEVRIRNDERLELCLTKLGVLSHQAGRHSEAIAYQEEVVAYLVSRYGEHFVPIAFPLFGLSMSYIANSEVEKAKEYLKKSVKLLRQGMEDAALQEHCQGVMSTCLWQLFVLAQEENNFKESESYGREAVELDKRHLGRDATVAHGLFNLSALYVKYNRDQEAEALLKESIQLNRELGAKGDREVLTSALNGLVSIYTNVKQPRLEEAETAIEEVLALQRRKYGNRAPQIVKSSVQLALIRLLQGRREEAVSLAAQALQICEEQGDVRSADYLVSLMLVGVIYVIQNRPKEAEPLFQKVISIERQQNGQCNVFVACALGGLAMAYQAQGRLEEAEGLWKEARGIAEAAKQFQNKPERNTSLADVLFIGMLKQQRTPDRNFERRRNIASLFQRERS